MATVKTKGGGGGDTGFVKTLKVLLEELDQPTERKKGGGPGRPAKVRGETVAVILHLYKDHVRWLDDYAQWAAGLAEDNVKLSRVETVRGILLGLAEFTVKSEAMIPEGTSITSERDLQRAVAAALANAGGKKKKKGRK